MSGKESFLRKSQINQISRKMKRIIITALIITGFITVRAQDVATPTLNYKVLEKKLNKSNENIMDEKSKLKPATWFNRGELLQDVHDVNTEFVRLGMPDSETRIYLGDPTETKTNDAGQELHVYERITLIYEGGNLVDWIETQQIHENPLPLALEAYMEALKLDEKGKLGEKVLANLDRLKRQTETHAIISFGKGEFDQALERFEFIIEISKAPVYEGYIDSVVVYNAALAARNADMHEDAAKYFEWATNINYGGSDAFYLLVIEHFALKDSTSALKTLQRGYELYPDASAILFQLVNFYLSSGDAEEGLKYLELAQSQESQNASVYFAKGTLYEKMGDKEKAMQSYLKSIELDPEYFTSWYNIGAMHFNAAVELYELANTKEDLEEYNKAKAKGARTLTWG